MEEKLTIRQVGVKYGIYLTLISIIYTTLIQILGQGANRSLGYLSIVFMVIILVLAHRDYKKSNEFMSYGEGLKISMIIVAISSVIGTIYTYIYIKFIDNSMLDQIRQQTEATLEKRGMSDEQIQQAMTMQAKFTTPEMIFIFGILGALFFGFIVALIVSAITKKSAPETAM